jgi:hypothetical protein
MRNAWAVLAAFSMAVVLVLLLWFLDVQGSRSGGRKPLFWDGAGQFQPGNPTDRGGISNF